MIEDDLVECVINLGPNLFYNSSMDSCLLITKNKKPNNRKNKILFIEASKEIRKEKTMSYLDSNHIERINSAYLNFKNESDFSTVVDKKEVLKDQNARLNVQLYVKKNKKENENFNELFNDWKQNSDLLKKSIEEILKKL